MQLKFACDVGYKSENSEAMMTGYGKATRYRWSEERGTFVDADGFPMLNQEERARPIAAPMVVRDVPEHMSPDGKLVTSRSQYREALKRTDCVAPDKASSGMKYLDNRNAAANGKAYDPEYKAKWRDDRKKALKAAGLA